MASTNHYAKTLRQNGLRATAARVSLLALLENESKPMSAKDIEEHPRLQNMDQATVYRNLLSLKSAGLIRQVDFQERFGYYEIGNKGDHHHIVCINCGRIEEVDGCPAQQLAETVIGQSVSFGKVLHHSLEFYGMCNACIDRDAS